MFKDIKDCINCINSYPEISDKDILEYLEWIEGETMFLQYFDRAKNDIIKAIASWYVLSFWSKK